MGASSPTMQKIGSSEPIPSKVYYSGHLWDVQQGYRVTHGLAAQVATSLKKKTFQEVFSEQESIPQRFSGAGILCVTAAIPLYQPAR